MNLKELQDCAREENARIEEHYSFPSESTRILAHMAKVTEEVGELGEAIPARTRLPTTRETGTP
jgi:NTP pyrophosphatase (non-canonical NTP hydrolase)